MIIRVTPYMPCISPTTLYGAGYYPIDHPCLPDVWVPACLMLQYIAV